VPSKRGSRLTPDFQPSVEVIEFGISLGISRQRIVGDLLGEFCDFWVAFPARRLQARLAGDLPQSLRRVASKVKPNATVHRARNPFPAGRELMEELRERNQSDGGGGSDRRLLLQPGPTVLSVVSVAANGLETNAEGQLSCARERDVRRRRRC